MSANRLDTISLDPATFPLSGLRIIEASAGTGKTYAIANLFLRLVAERGLGVEQILVVTFTRAATEELRGRVRERIRQALAVLEGTEDTDDEFLLTLKERSGEIGTERLGKALACMDEAAIFTIHSFCQRVLTDNAFESGAGFEAEFVNDDQEYRLQAIRDFWRRHCYPLSLELAGWVTQEWFTPDELLNDLSNAFVHHRLRILPEVESDAQAVLAELRPIKDEAAVLWRGERESLVELLSSYKGLSHAQKHHARDIVQTVAASFDAYFGEQETGLSLPAGFELFTVSRIAEAMNPSALKKGVPPPQHCFFDSCERIQALAGSFRRDFLVGLQARALAFCREEIRARKAAANVLAPDDLLQLTHHALHGQEAERLAACIRSAWPVALIDEFQDTDPVQYEIFHRVYADKKDTALIMIGDPKQAIYGFRGADVFTYLSAAQAVACDAGRFSLDTNWRSGAALVRAVNVLFSTGRPFVLDQAIGYQPVQAAGKADERSLRVRGDPEAALHFWHLPTTEENVWGKVIPGTWYKPAIADGCAAEIARLLNLGRAGAATLGDRPLQARDIAVLVRDRRDARHIQEALRTRGVGSAFITRESVFESEEAGWLLAVLEAVLAEGEEGGLRRALAGPVLGWDAARLERLAQDEIELEAVQLRFQEYARHWRRQGFMPMFNRLLHGESVPARLLDLAGGERALTNLRHLAELLQSAGREVHGGAEGLLRWYREELLAGRAESEDAQLRLESDENLVQIVTVHKSKGLQYPLVFLPYPWRSRPLTDKKTKRLLFHDADGHLTLDLGSDAFAEHLLPAERERLAEDMRLLYVALTRAEHRVYCTWGNFYQAAASAFAHLLHGVDQDLTKAPPGKALQLNDAVIGARLQALAADHPDCFALVDLPHDPQAQLLPKSTRPTAEAVRHFDRTLADTWRITSYSALIAGREDLPERPDYDSLAGVSQADIAEPETEARGVFAFPRGIRAGQCLHGILEVMDFQAGDGPKFRALVRQQLERQGLDPVWEEQVAHWLLSVLAVTLDRETGLRLDAVPAQERVAEMGFYLPLSPLRAADLERLVRDWRGGDSPGLAFGRVQGMLNGFIDLIVAQRGRYYLLDYKSNHLGNSYQDYRPERLDAAVRMHEYDLQYLIYCVALHRYLGKSLTGYDYQQHFGGVFYLFLRGMREGADTGIYRTLPPLDLVESLDRLFRAGGAGADP